MRGMATVTLPRWASDFPEVTFIAEGAPIPVVQGSMAAAELTPKKMAAITSLTGELADMSGGQAEQVVRGALLEAGARSLDAALFSTAAASAIRPAGILNGISPLSPTSGGGIDAVAGDLSALANAIATAGAGGTSIVYFAAPQQAASLRVLAPQADVIVAPSLDPGVVIAIEAAGFVSGFSGAPEIDVSRDSVIHMEDSNPAQISAAGDPNVVAAPVRSAFQTDLVVLRLILRTAWAMRAPGLVAYVTGTTW